VHPQAQHSDATQVNKNLLLSREAEVDTRPQLEIYADDVKCSHGATVGQLDADALFYLRARGIDPDAARDLLIHAFVGDVVERIALEPLRRAVERTLSARLLHGRDLGALA
jgi:Fe-S cluster assembly protein SufD